MPTVPMMNRHADPDGGLPIRVHRNSLSVVAAGLTGLVAGASLDRDRASSSRIDPAAAPWHRSLVRYASAKRPLQDEPMDPMRGRSAHGLPKGSRAADARRAFGRVGSRQAAASMLKPDAPGPPPLPAPARPMRGRRCRCGRRRCRPGTGPSTERRSSHQNERRSDQAVARRRDQVDRGRSLRRHPATAPSLRRVSPATRPAKHVTRGKAARHCRSVAAWPCRIDPPRHDDVARPRSAPPTPGRPLGRARRTGRWSARR